MKRKDYYNVLTPAVREKAIENTDTEMLNLHVNSMIDALAGGFSWDKSPEGFKYWNLICEVFRGVEYKLYKIDKEQVYEF
jgi:hypothetical protein